MRNSNYDKYPATLIENGYILTGWDEILAVLAQEEKVLAVDFYTGVLEDEVIGQLKKLQPALLIDTRQLMKPEEEILEMTSRFMTDDVLFGYLSNLRLEDYFDISRLEEARRQIGEENGKVIWDVRHVPGSSPIRVWRRVLMLLMNGAMTFRIIV